MGEVLILQDVPDLSKIPEAELLAMRDRLDEEEREILKLIRQAKAALSTA